MYPTDEITHGFRVFVSPQSGARVIFDSGSWHEASGAKELRKRLIEGATPEMIDALLAAEAALQVRLPYSSTLKQVKSVLQKVVGERPLPNHIKKALTARN